jgi:hypothetical protein
MVKALACLPFFYRGEPLNASVLSVCQYYGAARHPATGSRPCPLEAIGGCELLYNYRIPVQVFSLSRSQPEFTEKVFSMDSVCAILPRVSLTGLVRQKT